MRKIVLLLMLACSFFMSGCKGTTDDKPLSVNSSNDVEAALSWVEKADPEKAAADAIANKDYRLWVMAGRGERAPGLSAQQQSLKTVCGTRYLPGSTDVVVSDRHMELMVKMDNYAATYNQMVAKHCKE